MLASLYTSLSILSLTVAVVFGAPILADACIKRIVTAGAPQPFTVSGAWIDGLSGTLAINSIATGCAIPSGGLLTAGSAVGTSEFTPTQAEGSRSASANETVVATLSSPPPGSIGVSPGQSIQAAVNAAPEGTTFWIKAGVHRLQSVIPKRRQTFLGEPGAVLSGAKVLTTFRREGSYWVATDQTQQGPTVPNPSEVCQTNFPRCGYPEDLFINNVVLEHVPTLSAVGPGKWHFDYAADKIFLWDDPRGRTVETSVTPHAFLGNSATNVTIKSLGIEKYATPSPMGTIEARAGWLIEGNELRWNHNAAIRTGGREVVRSNNIHHNGGVGLLGAGVGTLIENNEISYNNTVGYNPYWGAGGSKWVYTTGLIVRGNFSHHNKGHGLWTDIDNIDTLYERNRVEDNDLDGIFHEISYRAVIRDNTCQRNGAVSPYPGWMTGGGIVVNSSSDVEIYRNTVVGNFNGIGGIQSNRGSGRHGPYILQNLYVHDNTMIMTVGRTGIVQNAGNDNVFTRQNNRWARNTYRLGLSAKYFVWMNADRTDAEWRTFGLDPNGTFTR
jgi:hypothetical protein